ncbi:hypothetical protein D3C71_1807070 [compost metagenome]
MRLKLHQHVQARIPGPEVVNSSDQPLAAVLVKDGLQVRAAGHLLAFRHLEHDAVVRKIELPGRFHRGADTGLCAVDGVG